MKRNSDGSYEENFQFKVSTDSQGNTIILGENLGKNPDLDAAISSNLALKNKNERVENAYFKGLGWRTNLEIAESYKHQREIALQYAQDGDILVFSGTSPIEPAIKTVEYKKGADGFIMSHMGMVTTINGKKYVIEIFAADVDKPEGDFAGILKNINHALKLTPLETALNRYGEVDALGNVTKMKGDFRTIRSNDSKAVALTTAWVKENYFGDQMDAIKSDTSGQVFTATPEVWFNWRSILNINNNDPNSFVCSEFIVKAYYEANEHKDQVIFGNVRDFELSNWQSYGQRISPQDVYSATNTFGKELTKIIESN